MARTESPLRGRHALRGLCGGPESCRPWPPRSLSSGDIASAILLFIVSLSLLIPHRAHAWTKRGHEIVASVAARILEDQYGKKFLRSHEFDLGYYTNVPDLIWRSDPPPTSKVEPRQHYMDWDKVLQDTFGSPKNLPVSFQDYKARLGDKFKLEKGVVPFRIHDLIPVCKSHTEKLDKENQLGLLTCLGVISHYTGDLSMPLHVSENHDGEMTGQKGIHAFFESFLVDELDPDIKVDVERKALKEFKSSPLAQLKPDEAVRFLMAESLSRVDELLKIDKEVGRDDVKKAKARFKPMILQQLVRGAELTAVVWKDILSQVSGFDEDHFFNWDGHPKYLEPGKDL